MSRFTGFKSWRQKSRKGTTASSFKYRTKSCLTLNSTRRRRSKSGPPIAIGNDQVPQYSLEELLAGITGENLYRKLILEGRQAPLRSGRPNGLRDRAFAGAGNGGGVLSHDPRLIRRRRSGPRPSAAVQLLG